MVIIMRLWIVILLTDIGILSQNSDCFYKFIISKIGGGRMIESYDDIPELKIIINRTKEKLNKLIAIEQGQQSEEVLALSRKLDNLIHYYIILQEELKP